MTTCLITGGAGNIAIQLCPHLIEAGYDVVRWDVASEPPQARGGQSQFMQGDLRDRPHVRAVFDEVKPDILLHFASLLSGASEANRELAWSVNVDATFTLLEECLRHDIQKFLFLSSLASFGAPLPSPVPEDFPQWPVGLYGVTKAVVERIGHYFYSRHGLDFRGLRLPIVVSSQAPAGASSAYASRAYIEVAERGQYTYRVRPGSCPVIIYIQDVLRAIVHLLAAPVSRLSRQIYNIQALSPTADEMARAIQSRFPDAKLSFDPDPTVADLIDSWPKSFVDDSARNDWGWQPQFDLDAMSDDFLEKLRQRI